MARLGNQVLELKGISKSYGTQQIVADFSYTFSRGERIGIIGKNGIGKTTLLNLFTSGTTPDAGSVEVGETIRFGYYSQEGIRLQEDKRVIEVLKEVAEFIDLGNGRNLSAGQFLQYFMFSPEQQYTYVSKLSGGERRRLHLLMVLMMNPNFLILDEPTNDLDLFTLKRLEEFLTEFRGCLVIVSHDRYFLDKLVDQLFIMEGDGRISGFTGTYTEYRLYRELNGEEEADAPVKKEKQELEEHNRIMPAGKRKLTYREKLEFESLDREIPIMEQEKTALEYALQVAGSDYNRIREITEKLEEINRQLDIRSQRWLDLSEFL
jgi:ABC transport system ATP-binding/permease protein